MILKNYGLSCILSLVYILFMLADIDNKCNYKMKPFSKQVYTE